MMTTLHQVGWYNLIIAHIWSAQGAMLPFGVFVLIAGACFFQAWRMR